MARLSIFVILRPTPFVILKTPLNNPSTPYSNILKNIGIVHVIIQALPNKLNLYCPCWVTIDFGYQTLYNFCEYVG